MSKLRWISFFVLIALLLTVGSALAMENRRVFHAELSGETAGTPSEATGKAVFVFSKDGMTLKYKVGIHQLENTTMAHIHIAPAPGGVGPIVLWLYPDNPPPQLIPGIFNGLLARRKVDASALVGPLAGMTLEDLRQAILEGRAYVNVHTTQFPAGEISGFIHP